MQDLPIWRSHIRYRSGIMRSAYCSVANTTVGWMREEDRLAATRESIEAALRALNDAENSSATPAEKTAEIDKLMAADLRTWRNGIDHGGRDADREEEAVLFAILPNYHRDFDHVLIDPPHAAVAWLITATNTDSGADVSLPGSSFFRFDDQSRIAEAWMFLPDPTSQPVGE